MSIFNAFQGLCRIVTNFADTLPDTSLFGNKLYSMKADLSGSSSSIIANKPGNVLVSLPLVSWENSLMGSWP